METKTLPAGTTQEQWDRYENDMIEWENQYESIRPKSKDFATYEDWNKQLSKWLQDKYMSEPNKPGYYRANND